MTEHDDELARLFERIESPALDHDFAARVSRRLRRKRAWTKARAIAGALALAVVAMMALLLVPLDSFYPVRSALEFMTSYAGMVVCAVFAIGGALWIKLAGT